MVSFVGKWRSEDFEPSKIGGLPTFLDEAAFLDHLS